MLLFNLCSIRKQQGSRVYIISLKMFCNVAKQWKLRKLSSFSLWGQCNFCLAVWQVCRAEKNTVVPWFQQANNKRGYWCLQRSRSVCHCFHKNFKHIIPIVSLIVYHSDALYLVLFVLLPILNTPWITARITSTVQYLCPAVSAQYTPFITMILTERSFERITLTPRRQYNTTILSSSLYSLVHSE